MSAPPPTLRGSGVLLHVSSLPSDFGIGDMGPGAHRWIDFLAAARQGFWQVLPLNPTSARGHNSPYQSVSAFAANPLLVSPALLREDGLLDDADLATARIPSGDRVDFSAVTRAKNEILDRAYERFRQGPVAGDPDRSMVRGDFDGHSGSEATVSEADGVSPDEIPSQGAFARFCGREAAWLDDYCLFVALHAREGGVPWTEWPAPLRLREGGALDEARRAVADAIEREKFRQFVCHIQWRRLKRYANARGVALIGDLPYYPGLDSVDVWSHPQLFKLDEERRPRFIAGVPPDRFSDTGQLWNNPVFDWEAHGGTGYAWWLARVAHNLRWFDRLRIDHFRGFAAYWEVPADAETAEGGRWIDGPQGRFLDAMLAAHPTESFIAEDLGYITDDVRDLIARYDLAAMNVLLFAFDGDNSVYAPHNHRSNMVVYTGTHDNNTARGWFEEEASEEEKQRLCDYLGSETDASQVHWDLVRLAMMSVCRIAVVPMQDILGLGAAARMNRPGVEADNWEWRMGPGDAVPELAARLAHLVKTYGRC